MGTRRNWAARIAALLAVIMPVGTLSAQSGDPPPPPERDTQSPTGVSLTGGAYSTNATDLRIGEGQYPQALVFERQYSSSLDVTLGRYDGFSGWGWATNLVAYLSTRPHPIEGVPYPPNAEPWQYSVIVGTSTVANFIQNTGITSGNFAGPFGPYYLRQGTTLQPVGSGSGAEIVFTEKSGIKHYFYANNPWTTRKRLVAPDGTELTFHGSTNITAVTSNRGFAILFETSSGKWTKACAVNLAVHDVSPGSPCPAGVPTVTYTHASTGSLPNLLSATDPLGNTVSYGYTAEDQVNCITLPGQTGCQISNTYNNCVRQPSEPFDPPGMNAHQQVLSQTLITGETISYSFPATHVCPPTSTGSAVTMTLSDGTNRLVQTNGVWGGMPVKMRDGLGRETNFVNDYIDWSGAHTAMISATFPEENSAHYEYDLNGNIDKTTLKGKPGSGVADFVWEATYGPCNQPLTQIDANGNQTDSVYDTVHCGILKKTLPADPNGIRPETRYSYAQKYAWLKSGSSYVQAASPVWVLASEEYCRTSAADANGDCAAGASDEVVTTYEYQQGSATQGSNVFRIGMAVTAQNASGQMETLRRCYGLDEYGRRVSETQPKANLASCAS